MVERMVGQTAENEASTMAGQWVAMLVALRVEEMAPQWVANLENGMVGHEVEMMVVSWAAYWGLILVVQTADVTVATMAVWLVEKMVERSVVNSVVDLVEQTALILVPWMAAEMVERTVDKMVAVSAEWTVVAMVVSMAVHWVSK